MTQEQYFKSYAFIKLKIREGSHAWITKIYEEKSNPWPLDDKIGEALSCLIWEDLERVKREFNLLKYWINSQKGFYGHGF